MPSSCASWKASNAAMGVCIVSVTDSVPTDVVPCENRRGSEASGVTRVGGGSAHGIGGVRGEAVLRRAVLPRVAAEEVAAGIIPIAPVAGVRHRRLEGVPIKHLPAEEEVEVIEAHSRRALAPTSTTTRKTRTLASGRAR